ncbi:MAG: GPW/gp25 family protein [Methanosarcinaceae archaeon]|nr:GPW/gp25 family protein [Methanosarcinaceae archaeon]
MDKDFLGVGVSFPLRVENGKIAWSGYEKSIRESIMIILGTAMGERVMRPDFGCGIHDLAFSVNDVSTAALAIFYVEEALKKWEPRIEVINVDANADKKEGDRLNISIEYRDISTNNRYNLVYPFYLGRE